MMKLAITLLTLASACSARGWGHGNGRRPGYGYGHGQGSWGHGSGGHGSWGHGSWGQGSEESEEQVPSSDWPAAFISEGLVPSKIATAPPAGLSTTWCSSGVDLTPTMASVDSGDMAMRPTLEWPVEEGALYTVMMLDTGIERLEGLQYIHWMVENVPGNEVSLGDEVYEYVPPFHFEIGADGSLLDDGTAGGPILTLVYKQSGRIAMTERQSGCNAGLATRIGDKTALAAQYNLSSPVAGNFLYTVYSEATNPLLCRFTRCSGAPFPLPVAGVNDGPECTA